MGDIRSIVYLVVGILWILLEAGVAAMAFYRFRITASGILLGGAFALMAVKSAAFQVVNRVFHSGPSFDSKKYVIAQVTSGSLEFLLLIAVAVGIALIPLSLRRLSASS